MRGSIRKRCGHPEEEWPRCPHSWRVRVSVVEATGERRWRAETIKGSRGEAERKLTEFLHDADGGALADPGRLTAADHIERWLEHKRSDGTRPTTVVRYRQLLHAYAVPIIGRLRLSKIRPMHVRAIMDGMQKKGLAPATRRHCYRALSECLVDAVRMQLLTANPAQLVKPPRVNRPVLSVPDAAEVARLLEAARSERLYAALVIAATTGMRRGEIVGLRWRDVDNLNGGLVHASSSLQRIDGALALTSPKTDKSRRTVALPPVAIDVLKRQRKAQAERRLQVGEAWTDLDLVFDRGDGTFIDPSDLSRSLKRAAGRVGLPDLRLHDLRHFTATQLLKSGVHPKVVSEALGHASTSFTMDTYQHVLPTMQAAAAAAMQAALGTTL